MYFSEYSICIYSDFGIHSFLWLPTTMTKTCVVVYHDYSSQSFGILLSVIFLQSISDWAHYLIHKLMVSLSHISFSWQSSSYFLLPSGPHSVPLAKKWVFILTTQLCGFPESIYTDDQVAGVQRERYQQGFISYILDQRSPDRRDFHSILDAFASFTDVANT